MNSKFKIALAVAAGAALGAAAVQGLHAQSQAKSVPCQRERSARCLGPCFIHSSITAVQKAAGGRSFGTRGKIVASVGDPPKRVGISEWDSLEQVQTYLNSAERKKLVQDGKVVKIARQYIVEAGN